MSGRNYYWIRYSDSSGSYEKLESTYSIYEDAEEWASDKEQISGVRQHIHGLEQTDENIQVWEFKEIKGIAAIVLNLFRA